MRSAPKYTLFRGDCREILPAVRHRVGGIITDPPWGVNNDPDYSRLSPGGAGDRGFACNSYDPICGDSEEFDPSHLLEFSRVIVWGWQHFPAKLPAGSALVWVKKPNSMIGSFLSDAEIAWQNGGRGCYVLQHAWMGSYRESEERTIRIHPNQKPVRVMEWCIARLGLPAGSTICDPYMGSGSVGVACARLGYQFIGIELDPGYFDKAWRRVANAFGENVQSAADKSIGQGVLEFGGGE